MLFVLKSIGAGAAALAIVVAILPVAGVVAATGTSTDAIAGCGLGLPIPDQSTPTMAVSTSEARQREFKGVELYGWQGLGGEECFALLQGTNRHKEVAEIIDPRVTILGVEELGRRMSLLAVDESVTWGPPTFLRDSPKPIRRAFRYPPGQIIAAVAAQAQERGRRLTLLERRYWNARLRATHKPRRR